MSNISPQGEQSTSTEILALTRLVALGNSGASQAIQKTGPTTFANVSFSFFSLTVTLVSTTATLTAVNQVVLANSTAGIYTITIPTAVGNTGLLLFIKKTSSDLNTITIQSASGSIDGGTSATLRSQYVAITLVSDGTNWFVI